MSASDASTDSRASGKTLNIAIIFAICGALISLLIFLFMLKQEREAVVQQFQVDMNHKVATFEQRLTLNLHSLDSLQAYYLMSDKINADSFKRIVTGIAQRAPALQAMFWAPESGGKKLWVSVKGSENLLREEPIRNLIQNYKITGRKAFSHLKLDSGFSIVAITPAHKGGELVAIIDVSQLAKSSGFGSTETGVTFKLARILDGKELYRVGDGTAATDSLFEKKLGKSPWVTSYSATESYITQRMSYIPVMFLLTGLLISFLFAAYLKRIMGHLKDLRDEQEVLSQQLLDTTWNDPLTGIANRVHFDEALEIECRRAVREFSPLTLVLIELDAFDEYATHYGANGADVTLQRVASTLRESVGRPGDMVARVKDHQFAYILPSTNELVVQLAERCCKEVADLDIAHETSSVTSVVTVSIGVSTLQPSRFMTPERMLESAEEQLLKAQNSGGNQYQAYAEQGLEPSVTYSV